MFFLSPSHLPPSSPKFARPKTDPSDSKAIEAYNSSLHAHLKSHREELTRLSTLHTSLSLDFTSLFEKNTNLFAHIHLDAFALKTKLEGLTPQKSGLYLYALLKEIPEIDPPLLETADCRLLTHLSLSIYLKNYSFKL